MKSYRLRERAHPDLLQDLLLARGIKEGEQAAFLEPGFERDSHDPFLLPDMERAVERIFLALKNNEKVAVWSDYDADGLPAGVMLTQFLREIGLQVTHYIPHRHLEGYGLNRVGIEELAQAGATLMITADCGTTDHEAVSFAKEKNIDTIITDHHIVQTFETPAFALINPKRPDSKYPFSDLCGAGVAWKLVQAIVQNMRSNGQPFDYAQGREKWLLDLVGIGTLSDMVPLVGENRMLAHFGLRVLRRGRRPGLAALLKLLRIAPGTLTEDDVGFMISPRINAASRMGSPHLAARLLAAEEGPEAGELARQLQALNDERKGMVAATVKEANKRLAALGTPSPLIVLGNPNWRPGILGLVASALVETHGKPVFLWGREGGDEIKGSCRSDGVLNVVECMQGARSAFAEFGGHRGAGGFSVPQEKVHELHARLEAAYAKLAAGGEKNAEILIDRDLQLAEVPHALRDVQKMAPFGTGNEKPLFIFNDVSMTALRTFGKQNNHLELALGGSPVKAIAFFSNAESFDKKIEAGTKLNLVGNVELDWKSQPRIRVVDVI